MSAPTVSATRRLVAVVALAGAAAAGLSTGATTASAAAGSDTLRAGETLQNEQFIRSSNGYSFVMQGDGNAVIYKPLSGGGRTAIWATNTPGRGSSRLAMQTDGNLVLYSGSTAYWASGVKGSGSYLVMQTDGNLVMYRPNTSGGRSAVWASNTAQASSPGTGTAGARAEAAIGWMQARAGSTGYNTRCELAVELAFGTSGRFASAKAAWDASVARGVAHRGDRNPPRGALVYWNTSSNHHVGISTGDGRAWSTSSPGIGLQSLSFHRNYLGWAPPLY